MLHLCNFFLYFGAVIQLGGGLSVVEENINSCHHRVIRCLNGSDSRKEADLMGRFWSKSNRLTVAHEEKMTSYWRMRGPIWRLLQIT